MLRSDAQRNADAIVGEAARLLARDPRVPLADVAAAAGVHRATLHRHFASRDELVRAVLLRSYDEWAAAIATAAEDRGPAAPALQRLTEAVLEIGDRYRIYRYAAIQIPEMEAARGNIRASLADVLARAQDEGAARRDLTAAELAIVWSGLVLTLFTAIGDRQMTLTSAAEFAMRVLAAP